MSLPVCRVTGTITNPQGKPAVCALVTMRVAGTADVVAAGISTASVGVRTDDRGMFEIDAIQGLEIILTCEVLRYHRRVTVPAQSTIDFRSLT